MSVKIVFPEITNQTIQDAIKLATEKYGTDFEPVGADNLENACLSVKNCGVIAFQHTLGGKWKTSILWSIHYGGPMRFSDLRRSLEGITEAMLTKQLRHQSSQSLNQITEILQVKRRIRKKPAQNALKTDYLINYSSIML